MGIDATLAQSHSGAKRTRGDPAKAVVLDDLKNLHTAPI
jgi:hypothetical protein